MKKKLYFLGVSVIIIIAITVGIFSVSATGKITPSISALDGIPLCTIGCIAMAADKSDGDQILFAILFDMCMTKWCQ